MSVDNEVLKLEQAIVEKLRGDTSGIRDAFLRLDLKGDGRISSEELRVGLQSFGFEVDSDTTRSLVQKYDVRGEGCFDYSEFAKFYEGSLTSYLTSSLAASNPRFIGLGRYTPSETIRLTQEERLRELLEEVREKMHEHGYTSARSRHFSELFMKFDQNRDGKLSYDEIRHGFEVLGIHLSARDVVGLLSVISSSGRAPADGTVDLYDFFNLLQFKDQPSAIQPLNQEKSPSRPQSRRMSPSRSNRPSLSSPKHLGTSSSITQPFLPSPCSTSPSPYPLSPIPYSTSPSPYSMSRSTPNTMSHTMSPQSYREELQAAPLSPGKAIKLLPLRAAHLHTDDLEELAAGAVNTSSCPSPAQVDAVHVVQQVVRKLEAKRMALRDTFKKFDTNGDKTIASNELAAGLASLGISVSEDQCQTLISMHDRHETGRLQYCDFVNMISSTLADAHHEAKKPPTTDPSKVTFPGEPNTKLSKLDKEPVANLRASQDESTSTESLCENATAEIGSGGEDYMQVISYVSSQVYRKYHALKQAFSEFDQDGDRSINKTEFKKAVAVLGMNISNSQTNSIFDVFDTTHSGALRYHEFVRLVAASGNDTYSR